MTWALITALSSAVGFAAYKNKRSRVLSTTRSNIAHWFPLALEAGMTVPAQWHKSFHSISPISLRLRTVTSRSGHVAVPACLPFENSQLRAGRVSGLCLKIKPTTLKPGNLNLKHPNPTLQPSTLQPKTLKKTLKP